MSFYHDEHRFMPFLPSDHLVGSWSGLNMELCPSRIAKQSTVHCWYACIDYSPLLERVNARWKSSTLFFLIVKNVKVHNLTVLRFWKICKHYVCISHSGLRNIIQNKERIKNKEANWNKTYHMCVRVCVYTSVYKLNEWSKILRQIKTISN